MSTITTNTLHKQEKPLASELPMPETGMIKASNQGEGFERVGWRFSADNRCSTASTA